MASQGIKREFELMNLQIQDMYNRLDIWEEMNGVNLADYYPTQYETVKSVPNAVITKNAYGETIGVDMDIMTPKEFNPPAVIDSNVPNTMYSGSGGNYGGSGYRMNGSGGGTTPNVFSSGAKVTGTGTKVLTTACNVASAVGFAALGAKLGKAINSSFGGEYAWTPTDWADWVSGLDPVDQVFFRTLFDVDGTMYMPEDMLGSMYKMFDDMGVWSDGYTEVDPNQSTSEGMETGSIEYKTTSINTTADPSHPNRKFSEVVGTSIHNTRGPLTFRFTKNLETSTGDFKFTEYRETSSGVPYVITCADNVSDLPTSLIGFDSTGSIGRTINNNTSQNYTYDGKTVYYKAWNVSSTSASSEIAITAISTPSIEKPKHIAWLMEYGEYTEVLPTEGIESEPTSRASTQIDPTLITGNTPAEIAQSLKNNYPELFGDSIYEDVPQEDGTTKRITYVPVPYPDKDSTGKTVTGTPSQNNPQVDTETQTDDAIKDLIDTLTDFFTNPPTTGTGGSPSVVVPAGSASSLWKIYNPTQAQVDAFGAWLWSSNFVEQIKKLFNDPMQAIIGIHKVFATPSIGGTATIKVGYLDSGVSSDYIDDQYTTIDCGTVSLRECFGNVFDYAPYTRVSLYLPFIGIVDLDVADVMRASINVVYHVDVLTGACLADVKVIRDACGGVLYQYSGSAIVTYPVSSGNYMGMVAGVLSVASGIAGTVLSGGALAPALIGGAVGASHLHTDVSHSGGFSGCAGAMGGKVPYIIVSRPQPAMAGNYEHFTGMPANAHVTLANCSGMTRVKSVYVKSILRATDEEKDMIENQLKTGVLV